MIWLDNREWMVYRWLEAVDGDPDMEPVDLSDSDLALQWTRRFAGDDFAIARLEAILRECASGAYCDDDAGVLEHIAERLSSGELLVASRKWDFAGSTSAKGAELVAPPFDPSERKKYQPDTPRSETEEGFPDDDDLIAIAEVQREAAAAGVPFCEECERARRERENAS